MADVAAQTGWSQQRFIERFKAEVGLTPTLYFRLSRFKRLLQPNPARKTVDWADAALNLGYFNQAYFNEDFREFSGKALRNIWRASLDYESCSGSGPARRTEGLEFAEMLSAEKDT